MLRNPADKLEGDSILDESPGASGLLLWRTANDVTLWGTTPEDLRGSLFSDADVDGRCASLAETGSAAVDMQDGMLRITRVLAIDLPPAVSASVDTIHRMLTLGERADASILSICCLEVAAWAHRSAFPLTAVTFAQAAALAAPECGDAALHTGIYALRARQVARAATWLRRAYAVSRRERNRPAYCAALVELGVLYEALGEPERAERYFRKGYRAARRFTSRSARMHAAYGLFRSARARRDSTGAAQFALAAQRAYDPDLGSGLTLLLDLARFWTDLDQPVRAQAALRRLGPSLRLLNRPELLSVLAMTARAKAVAGNLHRGASDARAAWALLADETIPEVVRFSAVLDLAHAARVAGDFVSFTHAKRVVLRLVPQAEFPAVVREISAMWPGEATKPVERRAGRSGTGSMS